MTLPASIDTGVFMTAVGWTLLNFIWQGALIAGVVAVTLRTLAVRNPRARYGACCVGLAAMMMAPPVTLLIVLAARSVSGPSPVAVLAMSVAPTAALAWITEVLPQLAVIWIVGVLLLQTRLFVQWSAAQRMRRSGVCCARAPWPAVVAELCEQLGIRRTVAIVESTVAKVPMVIGWLRPVVLVPAGLMTGLTQHQLRAIIAHELAHVRRHDYLVNLIQALLETLLFYHPAVWWLSNRLRVEREYCCDDVAVNVGGDAISYARTLSLLETIRSETPQPALASTGGTLMTRIQRLLGVRTGPQARTGGWMAPAAITIAVVTACSALTLARPAHHEEHPAHDGDIVFFGGSHDVDMIAVLRDLGSRDTEFFEVLREAGLDNATMMMILEKLGPDEQVQKALERAAMGSRHLEFELHRLHGQFEKDVAAGLISKEQATKKYHLVLQEMKGLLTPVVIDESQREMDAVRKQLDEQIAAGRILDVEAEYLLHDAHDALKAKIMARGVGEPKVLKEFVVKLHGIGTQLKADLAERLITEAEAKQRYVEAGEQFYGKLHRANNARFPGAVERLHKIHETVRADLEAGRITQRQAEERIHAAAAKLHKRMAAQMEHPRHEMTDSMRARLHDLHDEIKADYEAGIITKAEAGELMQAAKLELHEQYRARFERRHADKGHNKDHD